jgi:hypothetical protein
VLEQATERERRGGHPHLQPRRVEPPTLPRHERAHALERAEQGGGLVPRDRWLRVRHRGCRNDAVVTRCGSTIATSYARGAPPAEARGQLGKTFTARAITRMAVASATTDCTSIVIFAHMRTGSVSVGLNAVELVNERYR